MPVLLNPNKIFPVPERDSMVAHAVVDGSPPRWFGVGVNLATLGALAGRKVKPDRAAAVYADFLAEIERAATARFEADQPPSGTVIMLVQKDLREAIARRRALSPLPIHVQ